MYRLMSSEGKQKWAEHQCNLVVLVHGSHVPATRGKVTVPGGGRKFMQNCVKKAGSSLTWCSQPQAVVNTPVHSGGSPRAFVVAQEVDGLAVFPCDGTPISTAPEFVPAMFGQPLANGT